MTIDWNAPLEAYHPDGRVVDVEFDGSHSEDLYGVTGIGSLNAFHTDGRAYSSDWKIRNRKPADAPSPELVERMVAYCRIRAFDGSREAKEIMSELEPKPDPDLELAIKTWEEASHEFHYGDKQDAVDAILAAIKRVRAEK